MTTGRDSASAEDASAASRCPTVLSDRPYRCDRPTGHDGYHSHYDATISRTALWTAPGDAEYEQLSNLADIKARAAQIGYDVERDPEGTP